ncbi:heme-binding protein [Streptomyces sp. NPDC008317]|uniref:GlcG/HbpS family heme-binding protein n=1 Tax=Streptomyces sp. NPDC008317 TaxID=3364827 RepID=UPI0036F07EE8
MKKMSSRTRVLTGAVAVAAVGAATFGAVSATAAAPAASGKAAPASASAAASGKDTRQVDRLTTAAATKAAQAALDAANRAGQRVTVAVVDRDGNTVVTLRGDGAGPQSYESAERKAYTAVSWNAPTSELSQRLQQTPQLKDIPGTLFLAGAVPVTAKSGPVAAVGVAGAPSGDQDEQFARAGAATLGH